MTGGRSEGKREAQGVLELRGAARGKGTAVDFDALVASLPRSLRKDDLFYQAVAFILSDLAIVRCHYLVLFFGADNKRLTDWALVSDRQAAAASTSCWTIV